MKCELLSGTQHETLSFQWWWWWRWRWIVCWSVGKLKMLIDRSRQTCSQFRKDLKTTLTYNDTQVHKYDKFVDCFSFALTLVVWWKEHCIGIKCIGFHSVYWQLEWHLIHWEISMPTSKRHSCLHTILSQRIERIRDIAYILNKYYCLLTYLLLVCVIWGFCKRDWNKMCVQWRWLHGAWGARAPTFTYGWARGAPWVGEQQTRNWPNCTDHHESAHQND